MTTKKIVRYSEVASPIVVGLPVMVWPVDHPDVMNVTNNYWATTTRVVRADAGTGEFETLNTLYVLA